MGREPLMGTRHRQSRIAPIDAPSGLYVFPNENPPEKEGIVKASGAVSLAAATTSGCP